MPHNDEDNFWREKSHCVWFDRDSINSGYNALDVPAANFPEKTALIYIDEKFQRNEFSFKQILDISNQFANFLREKGVQKGDRVFFYMQKSPYLYAGFLSAIRLGAIAGTLFPAFNQNAIEERLANCGAKIVVTEKNIAANVTQVKHHLVHLKEIICIEDLYNLLPKYKASFQVVKTHKDDPCFMLYTSATGNTPTCGVVIPHKAILQQKMTAKLVLDFRENDLYWCTSDPGWVTGVVYSILAPMALGITQLVYSGRFDADIWCKLLKREKISVFYTAPTALRMLRQQLSPKDFKLNLRHLCTVGEALDPATYQWAREQFGVAAHDTWWQTETGAMMVTNRPGVKIKLGSMGKPIPGLEAEIIDDKGNPLGANTEGFLAFKPGWPSMMTKIWKNEKMYKKYFSHNWYISGDKAMKDKEGYFTFIGRADDVIKTSGERVGPFEVESSLMQHPAVLEAGVIGKPDSLRGQIIKAFVVLKKDIKPDSALVGQLQQFVKTNLAKHAYPREIEFIDKLPKNRSGKIVRRILKAKELGTDLGNTSTLED